MADFKDVIGGLRIIAKYQPDGETCAQYAIIYAGHGLKQEDFDICDQAELHDFGWRWDNDADCWAIFT